MECAANAALELAKCLWGSLAEPMSYISNPTRDLKQLEHEVNRLMKRSADIEILAVAAEAEQLGQRTNQVVGWLKEVQDVKAECDRVLEEGNSHQQSKCLVWCCPSNYRSNYKLGKRISQLCNDVIKCHASGEFTVLVNPLPRRVRNMPIEETVCLDSMLKQVWEWLHDMDVGIIGLWGMGGVGKTTLLKKINEEFRNTSNEFNVILWVVVSKQVSLEKIRESIRKDLGIGDGVWSNLTERARAEALCGVLNTKKFVLLVDDIWERLDVAEIGIPIPNTGNGCKIVFTTRSEQVCGEMGARVSLKVQCLLPTQALELFQEKVGYNLNSRPDIQKYAELIVEECKGLPLALITVGRAMAAKKIASQWEHASYVLKNYPSKFTRMSGDVYVPLEFSYDSLNNPTFQQCFLYCALFPEDYAIARSRLIDLWIGEGFLSDRYGIHRARLEGEDVIESLKSACLLEGVEDEVEDEDEDEDEDGVKMHDVIRDMALWLAREHGKKENKIIVEEEDVHISKWKEAERVSLQGHMIRIDHVTEQLSCSRLTTLLVNETQLETLPEGFFESMHALKVLDMSRNWRFTELPTGVGNLANLQYLNLSKTFIKALPDEMKNLTSLQYLLLDDTSRLKSIPKEVISSLFSLKVFRKSGFSTFRDEKGLMEALEGLDQLNELSLELHAASAIQKWLVSPNLQRRTTWVMILNRGFTTINLPALLWGKILPLNCLRLSCCSLLESIKICEVPRHVNDSLSSRLEWTNLHVVIIDRCDALRNLSWLIYAPSLQTLGVVGCFSLEKIIDEDVLQHIDENASARLFSSLTSLTLGSLQGLRSIHNRTLSSPSLRQIHIENCPMLKKLPFDSNSGRNSLKRIKAESEWWSGLQWDDKAVKAFFTSKRVDCDE